MNFGRHMDNDELISPLSGSDNKQTEEEVIVGNKQVSIAEFLDSLSKKFVLPESSDSSASQSRIVHKARRGRKPKACTFGCTENNTTLRQFFKRKRDSAEESWTQKVNGGPRRKIMDGDSNMSNDSLSASKFNFKAPALTSSLGEDGVALSPSTHIVKGANLQLPLKQLCLLFKSN